MFQKVVGLLLLFMAQVHALEGEQFPLRSAFPEVKVISLQQLEQEYDDVVIIDARTRFEF